MSIPQTPSPLSNIIAAKTYNAAWFSGSTKEAQITAAIAAAVLDGALYVYIPSNMLPYNANAVTFNSTIRMIREGGDSLNYDVKAYGAAGDNVTDDSIAIQAAHNNAGINANIIYPRASYKLGTGIYINKSGQTILLNGSTFTTVGVGQSVFLIGNNGSNVFVKTDDTIIQDGTFIGASDSSSASQTAAAIGVQGPAGTATTPYVSGQGCSRITVRNCKESNFCFGFSATGADAITLVDFTVGGNKEITLAGPSYVGGYGALFQTCFNIIVTNLRATATNTDRHALYFSRDPNRNVMPTNVCQNVQINNPNIIWHDGTIVTGISGFEAAIECRSPQNITLVGGIITGGYGGFEYDATNDGPGKGVKVLGTQFSGQVSIANNRSCVSVLGNIGSIVDDVTIRETNVSPTGALMIGIWLTYCNNVNLNGIVGKQTNSQTLVNISAGVTNMFSGGNTWNNNAGFIYTFSGISNDRITIGKDHVVLSGGGLKYSFVTTPTNMEFGFVRSATLTTNGAGTYTIGSDPESIITSFTTDVNGLAVTLAANVNTPTVQKVLASLVGGETAFVVNLSAVVGQVATVTIKNQAGTLLPGNVNVETVLIQVLS